MASDLRSWRPSQLIYSQLQTTPVCAGGHGLKPELHQPKGETQQTLLEG